MTFSTLPQEMNPGADKTPGLEALLDNESSLETPNAYHIAPPRQSGRSH